MSLRVTTFLLAQHQHQQKKKKEEEEEEEQLEDLMPGLGPGLRAASSSDKPAVHSGWIAVMSPPPHQHTTQSG